jgi:hypothetical protein
MSADAMCAKPGLVRFLSDEKDTDVAPLFVKGVNVNNEQRPASPMAPFDICARQKRRSSVTGEEAFIMLGPFQQFKWENN